MRMASRIGTLGVLAAGVLGAGCASITTGKHQPVSVQATCDGQPVTGANCALRNNKGEWFASTPGSVTIQKSYGDLTVECRKDGYTTALGAFRSASNGGVWGNLIAGGIIGYAVDAGSGAGFDYPTSMMVQFAPPCPSVAEAAPAP